MMELDSYLEGLYDDLSAKTKSTALILQLAREPENLIELVNNSKQMIYIAVHSHVWSAYSIQYGRLSPAGSQSSAER